MTFDSFLNAVIPWIVGIGGVYILYRPLKEPLSGLFGWIGNMFRWGSNKVNGEEMEDGIPGYISNKEIQYE